MEVPPAGLAARRWPGDVIGGHPLGDGSAAGSQSNVRGSSSRGVQVNRDGAGLASRPSRPSRPGGPLGPGGPGTVESAPSRPGGPGTFESAPSRPSRPGGPGGPGSGRGTEPGGPCGPGGPGIGLASRPGNPRSPCGPGIATGGGPATGVAPRLRTCCRRAVTSPARLMSVARISPSRPAAASVPVTARVVRLLSGQRLTAHLPARAASARRSRARRSAARGRW